ncbi:PREDICTED: lipase 3 [Drosophila arizonae]|uniref:Lipase n=1 Tax=Drosophila arizonae TaxID=7263 RepID=A0ABM1NYB0_DROAR|nr:PREDICTED: lipase 3 [Drosophila arizonae]
MLKQTLLVLALSALSAAVLAADFNPFIDIPFKRIKTSAERIESHGYPAETHEVVTEDGYVLNMFRIPYSPKLANGNAQRPAVLIQHGLFSCSDCFLLNGPDNALAYNYADAGYDVWLGNARGNIYSRNNTRLSTSHPYFWAFSWHEIGAYDLPAMIDHILATTGERAVHYVGHSQGCTTFFVMGAFRPEYNAKIKTAHMLAPPIFMGNTTTPMVVSLADYVGSPGLGAELLQNQVFLPMNPLIQRILDTACSNDPYFLSYCKTLAMLWADGVGNLNVTLLPQVAETHPAGISTNQGIHFIQSYVSNEFRRYDWGPTKNKATYGTQVPPSYDITKITSQVHLYVGLADESANVKDVARLPALLPNMKELYEIPDETWGHLDFIFARQVKQVINDRVIASSKAYDQLHAN